MEEAKVWRRGKESGEKEEKVQVEGKEEDKEVKIESW